MEKKKIKGLVAPTVTPMDRRGELTLAAVDAYAEFLIKRGVQGVFLCGTTGESLLLDNEERKREAEAWMPYADRLKILVHVGSTSYKTAADLAEHAQRIGAHAISAMGPCFLQPKRVEELVAFNRVIAEKAPETPYYYYHIPGTSGVNVNMLDFLSVADREIPTLAGIKYTSYNSMEMQECIDFGNRRYDILHGHDETLLTGLVLGATGGIGTSYNLSSPLYNRLIAAFERGDLTQAVALQAEAVKFIKLMIKYVNSVVSIKAMLNILGIDCGPVRLPMQNLTPAEMNTHEGELKQFDWL